ncbi:hypothetical protein Hdeb2414_s0007g00242871 [Helianthus debilis subsp. tardiflorus]
MDPNYHVYPPMGRPEHMQADHVMQDVGQNPLPCVSAKKIKVRQKWNIVKTLNDRMTASIESRIRQTCFGPYLDIKCVMCDSLLLLGVAQLQVHTPTPKLRIIYRLGQEILMFTPKQFCLITGLRFGSTNWTLSEHPNSFKYRFFPGHEHIAFKRIRDIFEGPMNFTDEDCTRICLLMLLGQGFLGLQDSNAIDNKLLHMMDNLNEFNQYPWGNFFWESTYLNVYDMHVHQKEDAEGFSLDEFVWPSKMWILEVFPEFKQRRGYVEGHSIPRFLGRREGQKLMKGSVDGIFANAIKRREYKPLNFILPTEFEAETQWFISSSDYLDCERQIYQPAMPTELPPQMQHPIQSTENCSQQKIKDFIGHLFGNDHGELNSEIRGQLPQMHGLAPEVPV